MVTVQKLMDLTVSFSIVLICSCCLSTHVFVLFFYLVVINNFASAMNLSRALVRGVLSFQFISKVFVEVEVRALWGFF